MESERWNPWRALRERPQITLRQEFLRGRRGLWVPHGDGTSTIWLDPRGSRRERRCTLAHELVHEERGIAYTASTPRALVQLEERSVERITVARLVPVDELLELAAAALPVPFEVWEIADEFDVDHRTARAACRLAAVRLDDAA